MSQQMCLLVKFQYNELVDQKLAPCFLRLDFPTPMELDFQTMVARISQLFAKDGLEGHIVFFGPVEYEMIDGMENIRKDVNLLTDNYKIYEDESSCYLGLDFMRTLPLVTS